MEKSAFWFRQEDYETLAIQMFFGICPCTELFERTWFRFLLPGLLSGFQTLLKTFAILLDLNTIKSVSGYGENFCTYLFNAKKICDRVWKCGNLELPFQLL